MEQTIRGTLKMLQMMAGTWWRKREAEPSAEVINGWLILILGISKSSSEVVSKTICQTLNSCLQEVF